MVKISSKELREKFVSFFKDKGHVEERPSSLISKDDSSVLFTTAGMQQFKRYYLKPDKAPAPRIVTIQPCIRTSDIDEVGDESHLTFFEMMGNFSFGDYFKKEAIEWAKEFLEKELGIEPSRISTSVFKGDSQLPQDKESIEILKNLGYKEIELYGRKENFWGPTGDEGPCGPTMEFYIDGMEVWNLVFNEYYKTADGKFEPLKAKGVDTGLGLERIAAIMQGEKDLYKTELFWPIIKKIEDLSGKKYEKNQKAFRVVADHLKTSIFLSAKNISPSNVLQGYIMRRLIRRAVRYSWLLDIKTTLGPILSPIIYIYRKVYPELGKGQIIIDRISQEEDKFREVILNGLKRVDRIFAHKKPISPIIYSKIMQLKNRSQKLGKIHTEEPIDKIDPDLKKIGIEITNKDIHEAYVSGKEAFDLYQTYGFPLELILDLAQKARLFVGISEFNAEIKKHQEISRAGMAKKFKSGLAGDSEKEIKYHTATHLLLAALRQILGKHLEQRGSNITEERLRFDFNYPEKLSSEQIKKVEDLVNEKINEDLPVTMEEMSLAEAEKSGALAVFKERYGDKVKVYSVGNFSKEICAGPHLEKTGQIGKFKIVKEESSGAGIRRIKAIISK